MEKYLYLRKNTKLIALLIIYIFTLQSCYQYPEIENLGYNEFNRVIGPEGGEINFYRNYEDDLSSELVVKMVFPPNAVNDFFVFNMYEFYNEVTYYDILYKLNRQTFSDFLYFVPFYESEGYREILNDSSNFDQLVNQHNSITFNAPVTVIYYNSFYENMPDSAILNSIQIPAENEWGDQNNVWVNYNIQGYPDGYDEIDMIYLILGRWTQTYEWGTGDYSSAHWNAVPDVIYDPDANSVTFQIYNTDNMFVMAI